MSMQNELTGMALDMAFVQLAWDDAQCRELRDQKSWFEVWSAKMGFLGNGATEAEAWAAAALKVVEKEYELRRHLSGWHWSHQSGAVGISEETRELAIESAKLDYLQRNQPSEIAAARTDAEPAGFWKPDELLQAERVLSSPINDEYVICGDFPDGEIPCQCYPGHTSPHSDGTREWPLASAASESSHDFEDEDADSRKQPVAVGETDEEWVKARHPDAFAEQCISWNRWHVYRSKEDHYGLTPFHCRNGSIETEAEAWTDARRRLSGQPAPTPRKDDLCAEAMRLFWEHIDDQANCEECEGMETPQTCARCFPKWNSFYEAAMQARTEPEGPSTHPAPPSAAGGTVEAQDVEYRKSIRCVWCDWATEESNDLADLNARIWPIMRNHVMRECSAGPLAYFRAKKESAEATLESVKAELLSANARIAAAEDIAKALEDDCSFYASMDLIHQGQIERCVCEGCRDNRRSSALAAYKALPAPATEEAN